MEHLSDDEVDLYVAGRLPEERERALEVHYLECADCLARVTALQDLANGLRPAERRPGRAGLWLGAVAAALALLALGLLFQGRGAQQSAPASDASAAVAPPPSVARGEPVQAALPLFSLRAPERGATLQRIELPPATPAVLLSVEVLEAGAPGTRFDVTLIGSAGASVLVVRGLPSDQQGRVLLPVSAPVLRPGVYAVHLTTPRDTLKIPFEIVASSR